MKYLTFCCQLRQQARNFRDMLPLHAEGWHNACHVFFVLRSLSTPGGSIEIPRRFSSLPLFFASGRFATFFFLPFGRFPARRPA